MAAVSITDLAEPLVGSPALKGVSFKCGNCVHFSRVPIVDIKGSPYVCGSPMVGRAATQAPCKEFKLNGLKMQDLPKGIQAKARQLIAAFDSDITYRNAKEDAVLVLIGWLSVYAYSLRKGLPLGSPVRVQGSDVAGELLHIDTNYAWIFDPSKDASVAVGGAKPSGKKGVRCQVEANLVYMDAEAAAERKAKSKADAKKAKAAPAKKKAPAEKSEKKATKKKAATKTKTKANKAVPKAAKKAAAKKPAKPAKATPKQAAKKKPAAKNAKKKALGKGLDQLAA